MKKFIKKTVLILCVLVAAASSVPAAAFAKAADTVVAHPNADEIETRYKTVDGIRYYRRWNVTKGCWVDPAWMPCP